MSFVFCFVFLLLGGPGGDFGGPGGGCLCSSKSSGKATTETIRKTATTRTTKTTTVRSCVKLYPAYFCGDPSIMRKCSVVFISRLPSPAQRKVNMFFVFLLFLPFLDFVFHIFSLQVEGFRYVRLQIWILHRNHTYSRLEMSGNRQPSQKKKK